MTAVLVIMLVGTSLVVEAQSSFRACRELSPTASRLSGLIGASPILERLRSAPAGSPEAVLARQDVLEAVVSASLEADAAIAEIENEMAQVLEVHAHLAARRDRFISFANLASALVGAGVGVVATSLQFSSRTETAGNAVGVAAGAASTSLVVAAARQERRGVSEVGVNFNMLAPFFEPRLGPEQYSGLVWSYLTMPLADTPPVASWRDRLLSEWAQTGRLEMSGSRKAPGKVAFLKSAIPARTRVNIGDLEDRDAMLAGVRARIALMKRDLAELMCTVRAERAVAQ
jgi:hypothetical protein